jgi:hypothetical protein
MTEEIRQAIITLSDTGAYVTAHENLTLFGMEWIGDRTHYFLKTRHLLQLRRDGNLNHEGVKALSLSEQITIKTIGLDKNIDPQALRVLDERFEPRNLVAQRDCLLNELNSSCV